MTWLSVTGSIFYYLSVPFTTVFSWVLGWVLTALAPLIHLGHYFVSGFLLPLKLLAKFETLYIYLGVAAIIGLVTGSILHLSSTVLISLFNLTPTPEETGRSAASVRAAREQKKLEDAWQSSSSMGEARLRADPLVEKKYAEWLEKDVGKRREGDGLLGQTILEEEDDSEDGF